MRILVLLTVLIAQFSLIFSRESPKAQNFRSNIKYKTENRSRPVAVITGTNRGLGLELTKRLKEKYIVYAICRRSSQQLDALGVNIIDNIDLSEKTSFKKIANRLMGIKIDLIINNAGICFRDTLSTTSFEKFERAFAVNTIAPIILVKVLYNQLNKGAKIIMMSSQLGSIGQTTKGCAYNYRSSKAALNSIGKALSIELQDKDIYTLLIHPGSVKTDMAIRGEISVETSVDGILKRIYQLDSAHSGKFYTYDGKELLW